MSNTRWMVAAFSVAVLSLSTTAWAADVTGILVDTACYNFNKANTTMAHKGMTDTCAADCAKKGNKLAVVTKDGEMYEITGELTADNNAKLVAHMTHNIVLTGKVTKGATGKPSQIDATALKMASQ
jgi:hypothetical protein